MSQESYPAKFIEGLESPWAFLPSPYAWTVDLPKRLAGFIAARQRPRFRSLKPLSHKSRWIVYFLYLPDSKLQPHHHFTLERLMGSGIPLLTICATPRVTGVPEKLCHYSDSVYWKAMSGYDFSAYTLAIEQIAERSPGADIMIMNDSMFGPFHDLAPFLDGAPWDLTGLTASGLNENHIQSYAFILRSVSQDRLAALRSVLFRRFAFNRVDQVIAIQELRLARIAARKMSVGAYWYADGKSVKDACLQKPFELLAAGFPFMKRSLLGKMRSFQETERVIEALHSHAHPV